MAFVTGIAPDAWRLLGARARDLLVPLWRHLAAALGSTPYSPQAPQLHASHAWVEAQAWDEVRVSVLAEPQWWRHVPLAVRLIESGLRRRRRAEAVSAWFQVCWHAPDQVSEAIESVNFPELDAIWQRFLEAQEESLAASGRQPALTAADFPAWMLLEEPTLASRLPPELPMGGSSGEDGYRLAHRWIATREGRLAAEEMRLRKTLKERQPALFQQLLRAVENDGRV